MNTQDHIINLEREYWQAMKDHDIEKGVALTHFPCVVSSPQGTNFITEEQYRGMMTKNTGDEYKDVEVLNPKVQVLGKESAIIAYEVEKDGKRMSDLSTWICLEGKWVCAFHSETPLH